MTRSGGGQDEKGKGIVGIAAASGHAQPSAHVQRMMVTILGATLQMPLALA